MSSIIFDCEVYPNFFMVAFRNPISLSEKIITIQDDKTIADNDKQFILTLINKSYTFIGFNCIDYDIPVMRYMLSGKTPKEIYTLSKTIIDGRLKWFQAEKQFSIPIKLEIKTIDLFNVAPGVKDSLKTYGGRLHTKKLQDLPYNPHEPLQKFQQETLIKYCWNDIQVTQELYLKLSDELEIRRLMSKGWGLDLNSKTDAQIAEAIFKKELKVDKSLIQKSKSINYKSPNFLKSNFTLLDNLISSLEDTTFLISESGNPLIPEELKREFKINNKMYRLGVGGLHSIDTPFYFKSDERYTVLDIDVTSYYPSIITNNNYAPKQFGDKFMGLYKSFIDKRIEAKRSGDKATSDALKITINGTYGKLGSSYSAIYAPDMLLQVTLTGQLSLILLILMMADIGVSVLSANTDGVLLKFEHEHLSCVRTVYKQWEIITGFNLEETPYKSVHFRDVNNYFAITPNGQVKGKGVFETGTLKKNPHFDIIPCAIIAFVKDNIPIETTIHAAELTALLKCINVRGGAVYNGRYLGKVVRFIWTKNGFPITYKTSGNKVPESDNCTPLMDLSDSFDKTTIDYERYITEAKKLMEIIGL